MVVSIWVREKRRFPEGVLGIFEKPAATLPLPNNQTGILTFTLTNINDFLTELVLLAVNPG